MAIDFTSAGMFVPLSSYSVLFTACSLQPSPSHPHVYKLYPSSFSHLRSGERHRVPRAHVSARAGSNTATGYGVLAIRSAPCSLLCALAAPCARCSLLAPHAYTPCPLLRLVHYSSSHEGRWSYTKAWRREALSLIQAEFPTFETHGEDFISWIWIDCKRCVRASP